MYDDHEDNLQLRRDRPIFRRDRPTDEEESLQTSDPLDLFKGSLHGVRKSVDMAKRTDQFEKDAPREKMAYL